MIAAGIFLWAIFPTLIRRSKPASAFRTRDMQGAARAPPTRWRQLVPSATTIAS
jgi:hypothetical protein